MPSEHAKDGGPCPRRCGNDVNCIEVICGEVLKDDPCNVVILLTLADTYLRNKQPEKALPHVLKSLELEPYGFYALRIAASIYAERGEHKTAYSFAKRLVTSAPIPPPTKTVARILGPFKWFAKVRRLNEQILQDEKDSKASYVEWVQYVAGYKSQSQPGP